MAATFIYGVDGAISAGGKIVYYVSNWSMAINTGVADTPDLGSSGPVRTYSKYRDFTGTISAAMRFDNATNATLAQEDITLEFVLGSTASAKMLKLVESSKSMYYGNVVFTNIQRGQPTEGIGSWNADWAQSNGPLAWTSDTTT